MCVRVYVCVCVHVCACVRACACVHVCYLSTRLILVLQHNAQAARGHGFLPLCTHDAADQAPI
jgi:hypothetical protein